jgi:hypothetical protein
MMLGVDGHVERAHVTLMLVSAPLHRGREAMRRTVRHDGRALRAAHGDLLALGLNDDHFDAVIENLSMTLGELGVGSELIDEVELVAESRFERSSPHSSARRLRRGSLPSTSRRCRARATCTKATVASTPAAQTRA